MNPGYRFLIFLEINDSLDAALQELLSVVALPNGPGIDRLDHEGGRQFFEEE
jgi:hypothetical protein